MLIYLQMLNTPEERAKFETLYYAHRRTMLHIAMQILKDYQLAEDAVQEAFLRLVKNFSKIGQVNCPRTRLFTVIIASEVEEYGWGETVYENDQGFFVTFGYSNNAASAPDPQGKPAPVHVGDLEGTLYPALEDGGDKTLLWFTEDGNALWVQAPLPDDELLLIAENVIVQLNSFTDLIEYQ